MKRFTYRIDTDENPESPREWDNLGTLCIASRRWDFGEVQLAHDADSIEEAFRWHLAENDLTMDQVIWLPVYGYSHSGLTINTTGYSCPWDSGQLGYIYVSKKDALKEYGGQRVGKKLSERVESCLKGEIETMNQYLTGDVYGYRIYEYVGDEEDFQDEDLSTHSWEEIDSCWGYYGEKYCDDEAKAIVERLNNEEVAA